MQQIVKTRFFSVIFDFSFDGIINFEGSQDANAYTEDICVAVFCCIFSLRVIR